MTILLALLLFSTSADGDTAPKAPSFDQFRVQDVFRGKGRKPELDIDEPANSPKNQAISGKLESPPDFAGQYWVAEFACGAECTGIAVIDMPTGRRMFESSVTHAYRNSRRNLPAGAQYRPKSRLLVLSGCPEGRACGSYFYEMTESGGVDLLSMAEFKPQP